MRLDLTSDEVDLVVRLVSGMDDCEDEKTKRIAERIERYLRRKLRQERDARAENRP